MADMDRSELDLVVSGTREAILMVEAGARGVTEQVIVEALEKAHEEIGRICRALDDLRAEVGKPKLEFTPPHYDAGVVEAVREFLAPRLDEAAFHSDKAERENRLAELKSELRAALAERWPE